MTATSQLPWLQDTTTNHVWSDWHANYRDVRIVDARNRLRTVFNLNTHDLSVATNRATLKALFLEAAKAADADHDGLWDDWEEAHWGGLTATLAGDLDGDGVDHATEFAFGSDPTDRDAVPRPTFMAVRGGANPVIELRFRRQTGDLLDYVVEGSHDLVTWTKEPTVAGASEPFRNLFDGTGMAVVTVEVRPPAGSPFFKFYRISAVNRR